MRLLRPFSPHSGVLEEERADLSRDGQLGLHAADECHRDKGEEAVETAHVAKEHGQTRHLPFLLPDRLTQFEVVRDVAVVVHVRSLCLRCFVYVQKRKFNGLGHDLEHAVFKSNLVFNELVAVPLTEGYSNRESLTSWSLITQESALRDQLQAQLLRIQ